MSTTQNRNLNTVGIVGVSSTRQEKDAKDRDRLVLTLSTPTKGPAEGKCQVEDLINLLTPFKGKKVKLDIRTSQIQGRMGTFPSSFIMINKVSDQPQATAGLSVAGNGNRVNDAF